MIGEGSNVQDGVVIHCDQGFPTTIGKRVVIGHSAVIHGATISDNVLIGTRCDPVEWFQGHGEYSIVAAGCCIPEGKQIPPRSLVMGVTGKVVRQVNDEEISRIVHGADIYIEHAKNYWKGIYK